MRTTSIPGSSTGRWWFLAVALVVGLTVLSGVIQGQMRGRWGPSVNVLAAAERLEKIPQQFGDWRMKSADKMDDATLDMLECHGYILRQYTNSTTGEVVNVTLILGPPGPIAVHTPEVCFSSRDYQALHKRERFSVNSADGSEDAFWTVAYRTKSLRGDLMRACWAWSAGSRWSAADDARFVFAAQPYLYKIQLAGFLPPGANLEASDPCRNFLRDFLPAARQFLAEPQTN